MRRTLLYATLLLMAGAALSATTTDKDSLYEVEVVVFENRHAPASGEYGPAGKNAAPIAGLDSAVAPVAPATGGYKLATAPLERGGQYRVLTHQRWIQPMDGKTAVKARRISAGNELDGLVRVYMSRYLHADVQLLLKDETLAGGERDGVRYHRLDEQRRVKNQEVHYYDHPRLGVLLLVSALEKDSTGR